jgi:hypothetical protein
MTKFASREDNGYMQVQRAQEMGEGAKATAR